MLPYKFKNRKCEEITFRNAAPYNMNLYLRIHTDPNQLPFNDLGRSLEYFDSAPTEYPTIVSSHSLSNIAVCAYQNPKFEINEMAESNSAFTKSFNAMTSSTVII